MNTATAELDTINADLPGITPALMESFLAGAGDAEQAARSRAWDAFSSLPAPTAFDEEWRRTYPEQFPFGKVQAIGNLPGREECPPACRQNRLPV